MNICKLVDCKYSCPADAKNTIQKMSMKYNRSQNKDPDIKALKSKSAKTFLQRRTSSQKFP